LIFGLALRFFSGFIASFSTMTVVLFSYIVWINLQLAIFNLIPVPPLDGSHILLSLLPDSFYKFKNFLYRSGYFFLLIFIFFFFSLLVYLINWIFVLITGFSLLGI